MQRLRGSGPVNENCNRVGLNGGKKLNTTTTTTTAIVHKPLDNVGNNGRPPRAALGDIGNRVNRSLQNIASKKPPVDVPESKKTQKEDVFGALRKIEPRKPLRTTASFKCQPNVNVAEVCLPPTGAIVTRHASMKCASTVLDITRPTETSKLKAKLTRTASLVSAVSRTTAIVVQKPVNNAKKPSIVDQKSKKVETEPSHRPIIRTNKEKEKNLKDENVISADSTAIKDSNAYSTAMIPNIDAEDNDNPQLASDFVNDIYDYLRVLEREQAVRENFLSIQQEIKGHMRAVLIDWLVQVHVRFHLLPETMYMTTMLIDRFLQAKSVPKDKLQLVGVSAMFVASKYEEMYAPEIGDFVYITDNSYSKEQVRCMERLILQTLDFRLGKPLPIHFLRRYSKAADADPTKHTLAKYLLELSLVEYSLCHYPPSMMAAAALWLSLKLLGEEKWTPTLVYYTTYNEADVMPLAKRLCQVVAKTHSEQTKLLAVRKKFSSTKFLEISNSPCLTSTTIREILSK